MRSNFDILVTDARGNVKVLAETKGRTSTSESWAGAMRRNLLAHGDYHHVPYFVLVAADQTYFWLDASNGKLESPPDVVVDTSEILGPYFERAKLQPGEVSGASFELMARSWFGELISGSGAHRIPKPAQEKLANSHFFESIRGGRLNEPWAA